MPKIFIRPKKGFQVRDLSGAVVPSYGVEVESNSFWTRKMNDRDVEQISEADFIKGKKAFEKAAEAETTQSTPPAGA